MNATCGGDKVSWRRDVVARLRQEESAGALEQRLRSVARLVVDYCTHNLERGTVVTLFGGLGREVDLVLEALPQLREVGLRTALFAVDDSFEGGMCAFEVDSCEEIQRSAMGAWEPVQDSGKRLGPESLQVVLVPGLAFCPQSGFRLGRGGGYFDRLLSRVSNDTQRIGVVLECQLLEGLPREAHDEPVQWIITEKRVFRVGAPE